jgi:hypothetical protein
VATGSAARNSGNGVSAMLKFRDSEGIEWTVIEIEASSLAALPRHSLRHPEFKDGWLLFQSPSTRKRLAPYPREWQDLSPPELEALCRRARPELPRPLSGEFPSYGTEKR